MSFFSNLINTIRGINANNKPPQQFVFGSIISGTYANWKTDPHPTILCLGNYQKNGAWHVHGFQLHNAGGDLNKILGLIKNYKDNGVTTNPLMFYNTLKMNTPFFVKKCYRTYLSNMCDFKTVNSGFSNISQQYCYPIQDQRDTFLNYLNQKPKLFNFDLNTTKLRENITAVINTVKVW